MNEFNFIVLMTKTIMALAIAFALVIGTIGTSSLASAHIDLCAQPSADSLKSVWHGLCDLQEQIDGLAGLGQVPIGTVLSYAGSTAPTNFMIADGSEISRTTFSALFNIIGTTYGAGDGSTTFNLPDLSDSFVRGKTTGTPGSTGGTDSHTHDVDPPLRTSSTASGHIHGIDPPGISSNTNGNHNHGVVSGFASTSFDSHNHFVPSASTVIFADCESTPCRSTSPSSHTHSITGSGSHQHTVQIRTNTDFDQGHTHFTDITPFSSATSGFHNHQTDIDPFSSASADSKPPFIELVMVIKVQ